MTLSLEEGAEVDLGAKLDLELNQERGWRMNCPRELKDWRSRML